METFNSALSEDQFAQSNERYNHGGDTLSRKLISALSKKPVANGSHHSAALLVTCSVIAIYIYCVPCMEGNEGKRKTDVRV